MTDFQLTDALDIVERVRKQVNECFCGKEIQDASAYMQARITEYERLYAEAASQAPVPDQTAQALIDRAHGVLMDGTPLSGEKVFEEVKAMQCPECGHVVEKPWEEEVSYCTACGFCTHPRVEKKTHGFWTCEVCGEPLEANATHGCP